MNLAIVTQDDPFYVPLFLDKLLKSNIAEIVGIVILPLPLPGESLFKTVRRWSAFGQRFFLSQSIHLAQYRIMDWVGPLAGSGRPLYLSIKSLARQWQWPLLRARDINDDRTFRWLEARGSDLIVSVGANQIFKQRILQMAPLGCLNVHGGPLPRYRGSMPAFWLLANCEEEAAVTVHYMDADLDNGDILVQTKFPITPNDTLHSLYLKIADFGAQALSRALELIQQGLVEPKPNPASEATYFSFPTRAAVRQFWETGRKLR